MFAMRLFSKNCFVLSLVYVIGVTCGVAIASIKTNITPDYVKLSVFNVGQGNCVLLKKGCNAVMIDAGTLKSPKCIKLLERELAAELKNTVIRAVVVTHRDVDHWGLFLDAKEGTMFYRVREILRGGLFREQNRPTILIGGRSNDKEDKKVASKLADSFSLRPDSILFTEDYLEDGGYAKLRCVLNHSLGLDDCSNDEGFHPILPVTPVPGNNPNDRSFVFGFSSPYTDPNGSRKLNTLLFTGDATGITLERLTTDKDNPFFERNTAILNGTNIAVLPHHGSDTHGSEQWQAYMFSRCPEFICGIYSVDADRTKFYHPKSVILGESISRSCNSIKFSHFNEEFILSGGTLYLLDKCSQSSRRKVTVPHVQVDTIGDFSKNVLRLARSLVTGEDVEPVDLGEQLGGFVDILSCQIKKDSSSELGELDVIVPYSSTNSHLCMPHEQSFFYANKGALNRLITEFPIYSTGDTPMGIYQIFLDDIGAYFYTQPRLQSMPLQRPQVIYPPRSPLYGYVPTPTNPIYMQTFPIMYDLHYGAVVLDPSLPLSGQHMEGQTIPNEYKQELERRMKYYTELATLE